MVSLSNVLESKQGLKPTTLSSYARVLKPVLHKETDDPTVYAWATAINNPNTKRAVLIALRSLGYTHEGKLPKITRGYPRRYDLPDEETLRLVLSYTKYEPQCLAMMYLGLRIGEACVVNQTQVLPGNRIFIDKQVAEWQDGGKWHYEVREPKSQPAVIDAPPWLVERLPKLPPDPIIKPNNIRASLHYVTNKYLGKNLPAHALRHFYATAMLTAKVPLPVVQRQMRHAHIATTLSIYAQFGGYRMGLFDDPLK